MGEGDGAGGVDGIARSGSHVPPQQFPVLPGVGVEAAPLDLSSIYCSTHTLGGLWRVE